MKKSINQLNKFNHRNTLLVLSSFPENGGELAMENAVARYAKLLLTKFPKEKNIVVLCEKRRGNSEPYLVKDNILVYPAYTVNSPVLGLQMLRASSVFDKVADIMVQFEFSVFGGKLSLPGLMTFLAGEKLKGKNITFMYHQVVDDIATLSGHLGLKENCILSKAYNMLMGVFYVYTGIVSRSLIVHDTVLAYRLSKFVNRDKIVVIPHGCDSVKDIPSKQREIARKYYGFNSDEFVVTAFGYRSWYKGTDWIVSAIDEASRKYPKKKIRLMVAGGASPTLKNTKSYKSFTNKLAATFRRHKDVVVTGYVPDREVPMVFAATDVMVFPYRTRMSASGALSLAFRYRKAIIASTPFSQNMDEVDIGRILRENNLQKSDFTFDMDTDSFVKVLGNLINKRSLRSKLGKVGVEISRVRSWENVGVAYLAACTRQAYSVSGRLGKELSYATK